MIELILRYTGVISTLSTFVIALFTIFQWKIAKNKRQDDLFNLRYKLYEKIINFIIEVKTDVSGQDDAKPMQTLKSWLDDKYLRLAQNIIFESKNLFGVDIADHLTEYLSKEHLFNLINEGTDESKIDGSWIPPLKFIEPFEKYLTIKS